MHRHFPASHTGNRSQRCPHHIHRHKRSANHSQLLLDTVIYQRQTRKTCTHLAEQLPNCTPNRIRKLFLARHSFRIQPQRQIPALSSLQQSFPPLTTRIPGATNPLLNFSRFRRTIPTGFSETASKAAAPSKPKSEANAAISRGFRKCITSETPLETTTPKRKSLATATSRRRHASKRILVGPCRISSGLTSTSNVAKALLANSASARSKNLP